MKAKARLRTLGRDHILVCGCRVGWVNSKAAEVGGYIKVQHLWCRVGESPRPEVLSQWSTLWSRSHLMSVVGSLGPIPSSITSVMFASSSAGGSGRRRRCSGRTGLPGACVSSPLRLEPGLEAQRPPGDLGDRLNHSVPHPSAGGSFFKEKLGGTGSLFAENQQLSGCVGVRTAWGRIHVLEHDPYYPQTTNYDEDFLPA